MGGLRFLAAGTVASALLAATATGAFAGTAPATGPSATSCPGTFQVLNRDRIGTLKLAADERSPAHLVFNRTPVTSKLRDSIAADLAARGLPVLRSALGNRAGFAHAFAAGLGVTEAAPRSTAAAELRALLDELRELTG